MQTKTVKSKDITWNFYVRDSLNEDHVLYLTELYEQKINLPPIKVKEIGPNKYEGVDGRHRFNAQTTMLERESIQVEIVDYKNKSDEIFDAFKSNLGGPLPPTREDVKHTIELMLAVSGRESVYKYFCPKYYDSATIRRYMDDIVSQQYHTLINTAKRAVLEGDLSVSKAAKQYRIKETDLRLALGGIKKGHKIKKFDDIKRNFTFTSRSSAHKYQAGISNAIELYEQGEISASDVKNLIRQVKGFARRINRGSEDWESRLEALVSAKTNIKPVKRKDTLRKLAAKK